MDVREKLVELIFKSLCRHIHKSCKLAENIADDLIADGVTVQEWISVKDRLPEVNHTVLVYGGNGITIDWLEDYGELGLRWGNLCCGSYKPEYWRPMPQPPKGE